MSDHLYNTVFLLLNFFVRWMAVMAFTSYPPIEKQLDALNSKSKGTSRSSRYVCYYKIN